MKRLFATLMSVAFLAAFTPVSEAQTSCPAEVTKAKEMLAKRAAVAKGQDTQAPRSLAGARTPDSQAPRTSVAQAPRGQDTQAPRGQDTQAPRGQQDVQAPRGQDTQAPRSQDALRGQDTQAPRSSEASKLIREAEGSGKAGNMAEAKAKADAAIK